MTVKTWQEKKEENEKVYEAAKKIISTWPDWKRALVDGGTDHSKTKSAVPRKNAGILEYK